jgi:hypothetical protein
MVRIVRLVNQAADGQTRRADVKEISRSDGIGEIANLGSTGGEASSCWPVAHGGVSI